MTSLITEEGGLLADDDQFRQSVRRFSRAEANRATQEHYDASFDPNQWQALAELGVLGLGTESGGGGAAEIGSVMEELGATGFVGPLVDCFFATHVLDDADAATIALGGVSSVSYERTTIPWGRQANFTIFVDGDGIAWLAEVDLVDDLETLGGDPWVRGELRPTRSLGAQRRATSISEIALSGYVIGAARRLVEIGAEYARDRVQFGRAIGTFQAVSHPLARCYARLEAARNQLSRACAELDQPFNEANAAVAAGRARLLACAAAEASAEASLQVHGGMGFVEGTLIAHLARRVRHVSLLGPPNELSVANALGDLAGTATHGTS